MFPPPGSRAVPPGPLCGLEDHPREQGSLTRLRRSPVRAQGGRRGRPCARRLGNSERKGRARAKYTCDASAKRQVCMRNKTK
eukprot:1014963-Pleurochrysis_carterae.AAC.1